MTEINYLSNTRGEPFKVQVQGMQPPAVNISTTTPDRHAALTAALEYHRDHSDDNLPETEEVINTAMLFEYYYKTGEYPVG